MAAAPSRAEPSCVRFPSDSRPGCHLLELHGGMESRPRRGSSRRPEPRPWWRWVGQFPLQRRCTTASRQTELIGDTSIPGVEMPWRGYLEEGTSPDLYRAYDAAEPQWGIAVRRGPACAWRMETHASVLQSIHHRC